jgi:hypothetical protein
MPVNPPERSIKNPQFSAEDRAMLDEIRSLLDKLIDQKSSPKEQREASKN